MLATMCGHGMVSQSLAKKMIDWVKEGRRTPEQAASYMTRFCSCGVFNPARAARVLRQAGPERRGQERLNSFKQGSGLLGLRRGTT
jgi:hypothetical protein